MGQSVGIYKFLVRKPCMKKSLGRSRHRGKENMNLLAPKFYFAYPVYKMQKYRTKKKVKL
jgi:hypothetical protein